MTRRVQPLPPGLPDPAVDGSGRACPAGGRRDAAPARAGAARSGAGGPPGRLSACACAAADRTARRATGAPLVRSGGRAPGVKPENGGTVVQRLPSPAERLILLTTSNREANLGVLLTYSRTCAAAIARLAARAT